MIDSWWAIAAWEQGPIVLLARVFWAVLSVTLHELAHGWTALRCGDRTPEDTGHMTWNPVVHMGQNGLLLFALIGLPSGAMPIDPTRFKGRYDEAKVALAGPTANLFLYALSLSIAVAVMLFGGSLEDHTRENLWIFFVTGAWLNIILAIFNLFPVPPLDGSRIVGDFWRGYREFWERGNGPALGMVLFFALFLFGCRLVSGPANEITIWTIGVLVRAMGGPGILP